MSHFAIVSKSVFTISITASTKMYQLGNVRTRNHGREHTCTLYFSSPVQLSPDPFEGGCALEKKIKIKTRETNYN